MSSVATPCELCGRQGPPLTKHHLIPKTRHSNKRNKKLFSRDEVRTRLAWICRPCHSYAHKLFTEKELEQQYNTIEALTTHPEMQKFIEWIRSKPAGFKPLMRAPRRDRDAFASW